MANQGQTTSNLEGLTIAAREAANATRAGKARRSLHRRAVAVDAVVDQHAATRAASSRRIIAMMPSPSSNLWP
jgi:hypothetical protein